MNKSNDSLKLVLPDKIVHERISERIRKGEILLAAVHQPSKSHSNVVSLNDISMSFKEWLDHTEEILKLSFDNPDLLHGFTHLSLEGIQETDLLDSFDQNLKSNIFYLNILKEKIEHQSLSESTVTERLVPETKDVFIIHGHDEANQMRLQKMLEDRFRLKTHLMIKEPGKGRVLIEKFEEVAQHVSYAFALLTPDDQVKVKSTESEYAQARPNAIFELGWFYGRLGRHRIAILFKEGTHLHTDLEGISRIEFSKSVDECISEIERELKEAGLIS